jgi:hypothetical protein
VTELLEALRQPNRAFGVYKNRSLGDLCREAADEIERLRAALKEIDGALVDGATRMLIGQIVRNALGDGDDIVWTAGSGEFPKEGFITTPYGVRPYKLVDGKCEIEWRDGEEPLEVALT